MAESRKAKRPFAVRNFVVVGCSVWVLMALKHRWTDTTESGTYTRLFDTASLLVGSIGIFAALLWSRKKPPGQ